jgi:hypothetical protein
MQHTPALPCGTNENRKAHTCPAAYYFPHRCCTGVYLPGSTWGSVAHTALPPHPSLLSDEKKKGEEGGERKGAGRQQNKLKIARRHNTTATQNHPPNKQTKKRAFLFSSLSPSLSFTSRTDSNATNQRLNITPPVPGWVLLQLGERNGLASRLRPAAIDAARHQNWAAGAGTPKKRGRGPCRAAWTATAGSAAPRQLTLPFPCLLALVQKKPNFDSEMGRGRSRPCTAHGPKVCFQGTS